MALRLCSTELQWGIHFHIVSILYSTLYTDATYSASTKAEELFENSLLLRELFLLGLYTPSACPVFSGWCNWKYKIFDVDDPQTHFSSVCCPSQHVGAVLSYSKLREEAEEQDFPVTRMSENESSVAFMKRKLFRYPISRTSKYDFSFDRVSRMVLHYLKHTKQLAGDAAKQNRKRDSIHISTRATICFIYAHMLYGVWPIYSGTGYLRSVIFD